MVRKKVSRGNATNAPSEKQVDHAAELKRKDRPTEAPAEWVRTGDLLRWTRNPRKNAKTVEVVRLLIRRFGFTRTIVVSKASRVVLAGNTAHRAAELEGIEWLPVRWFEGSEEEAEALALSDNRANELSAWDEDQVNTIVRELASRGTVVRGLGWSDDAIKRIVARIPKNNRGREVIETAKPKNPRVQRGEIWLCGKHRIGAIDSLIPDELARLVGAKGGAIDCVVTDPPYAIFGSSTGIGRDIADDEMVRPFFLSVFRTIEAALKKFGHGYVCCDWRSWASISEGAKHAGVVIENGLIWDKANGLGSMYSHCYEMIAFVSKLPKATSLVSSTERGKRQVPRPNIIRVSRATGHEKPHNASKPVALFEELITNSTDEGETVLDLFHGGGTTLVACENLGRVCYAADKDPGWVDVAITRWETMTGERATRE